MNCHRILASFLASSCVVIVMTPGTADAWTFTMIYSFTDARPGSVPWSGIGRDSRGNLYGTLREGGKDCSHPEKGCAAVFKLAPPSPPKRPDWTLTTLHRFHAGADGAHPLGDTLADAHGNFLGTTIVEERPDGGAIFEIDRNGKEVFRAKVPPSLASQSVLGLTKNPKGGYFGATRDGGEHGAGSVFSIGSRGTLKTIYGFARESGDAFPSGPVTVDRNHNIVGVDSTGTNGRGEVYRISPRDIKTSVHSFAGTPDGSDPRGRLYIDLNGNMFGVTASGGSTNNGTVFKASADLSGTVVLHSFSVTDGATPIGGLIGDGRGKMYGMTLKGGSFDRGTIFEITSTGAFEVLHHFGGAGDDGLRSYGSLAFDSDGGLLGMTSNDGTTSEPAGTVFKLKP